MAIYSDEFTGNGPLSASWTLDDGDIVRVAGKAESNATVWTGRARWNTQMDSANYTVEAIVDAHTGSHPQAGLFGREAGTSANLYMAYFEESYDASGFDLVRLDDDVWTGLDYALSGDEGVTIKLECDGTSIKMYENDVEKCSDTDSTHTGKYAGLICGTNGYGRWDNFSAEDLAGAGNALPMAMNTYRQMRE